MSVQGPPVQYEQRTSRSDDSPISGFVASERVVKLKQFAKWRRFVVPAVLLVPTLVVVATDLARRGSRVLGFEPYYWLTYAAALLESVLVWGALLYAASRRRSIGGTVAAVLFVLSLTFCVGGQEYFYSQYNAYLNVDVSVFGSNFMDSVVNQLLADAPNYVRAKLPPLFLAFCLLWVARRAIRPTRRVGRTLTFVAPVVLFASFFIPTQHRHMQAATPDTLYLHAVGGLLRTQFGFTDQSNQLRPRARESLPVPPLPRTTKEPRNVLFVILESVRADSACIDFEPGCLRTGATNELLPNRYPLRQMRALDSSTAISLAVLWSGVLPNESREVLHTWPLIFDYARAAGYDTAFWTSQNMMFGNARLWVKNLGVSKFCSATDLDPTSDLDIGAPENLLADRINGEIGELREPFLAAIQLSNVHYPYLVNPDEPEPFQPSEMSKAPDDNTAFKNFYQNAVHQQDRHLARVIRHLRSTEAGKRTVIVYTSDHGEAFREHGQMGHTFSVFDEEIHVPAWIDAPPGTISDAEAESLRSKREAFVFHVDIVPTILDLLGVLDDPKLAKFRTRLPGNSLLRPQLTERWLPMTNCAGVWSCAFENWGVMRKNMKVASRAWDSGWKCHDVLADPSENSHFPLEACGDLVSLAEQTFGRLPGQGLDQE